MTEFVIRPDELVTVREAMRELNRMLPQLELGKQEKLVITQKNRMAGVVLSVERYAELAKAEERLKAMEGPEVELPRRIAA